LRINSNNFGFLATPIRNLAEISRDANGTFVLQGQEIVENGKVKATWFVVPGSGRGDLSGPRGEGGFEGDFGKGSDGTLDYWFE
jgi:hypothetical protein